MSKLRKILAEIQQTSDGSSHNVDLYEAGTIENGTFQIKKDVLERVLEELDYDVDHSETPEEGFGYHFEMKGTGTLDSVKSQYGDITEDDAHYIQENLGDSEFVRTYVEDLVKDVDSNIAADHHIQPTFRVSGNSVTFEVTTD